MGIFKLYRMQGIKMIKGRKIKLLECVNVQYKNYLTPGKSYTILAGQGDGSLARSDGKVGAYIQSPTEFQIKCEDGHIRSFSYYSLFWEYNFDVEEVTVAPVARNPILSSNEKLNCLVPTSAYASALVEGGEISQGDMGGY